MDLFLELFRHKLFANIGVSVIALSLAFTRIVSFFHFAPVFSHKSVPSHVRIGLGLLLTTVVVNQLNDTLLPLDGFSIVFAVISNIALGFVMGFTVNVLFMIVTAGGEMMDSSMGFSSAQTFDPTHGGQTTIMGKFMGILTTVVFFTVNGPEALIQGIHDSFQTFNVYSPSMNINVFKVINCTGDIIRMGFIIVSPIVVTILVNDIILGLLSRAAPQINAFQISYTIKPVLGLIMWLIVMPHFFKGVMNLFSNVNQFF